MSGLNQRFTKPPNLNWFREFESHSLRSKLYMKNKTISFFQGLFDIRDGTETKERIVESIKKNVEFRGANLWTLIFAILIASIGLNINSIAIIIGAMLISPLMGPIVGLGLSLGVNDSVLLRKSVKNLSIATIIGISISTLYFYLSPISNVQSELLARISPTIYDVLIALFGGFAGLVGSTRIEKGNVIPGVAIATALMPPLCTAGYGLATGQPAFFFGALYLYSINCIFICLATFFGVEYLELPSVTYLDERQAVITKRIIAVVVFVMVVPAGYLAYVFVQENNFNQNAGRYIQEAFIDKGYTIIYKNVDYGSKPPKIELAFLSKNFELSEVNNLKELLPTYSLADVELIIKQGPTSLNKEEWDSAIAKIKDESEKVKAIEARLSSGFITSDAAGQILKEAQSINNKISKVATGNLAFAEVGQEASSTSAVANTLVVLFYVFPDAEPMSVEERDMLNAWIKLRMQNQNIVVYFLGNN